MNQPDLFGVGTREVHGVTREQANNTCTPYPVGSGPQSQTCKTCAHYGVYGNQGNSKTWRKCMAMIEHHTNGTGTDIKAGWTACRAWRHPKGLPILEGWPQVPDCVEACAVMADKAAEGGDPQAEIMRAYCETDYFEEDKRDG